MCMISRPSDQCIQPWFVSTPLHCAQGPSQMGTEAGLGGGISTGDEPASPAESEAAPGHTLVTKNPLVLHSRCSHDPTFFFRWGAKYAQAMFMQKSHNIFLLTGSLRPTAPATRHRWIYSRGRNCSGTGADRLKMQRTRADLPSSIFDPVPPTRIGCLLPLIDGWLLDQYRGHLSDVVEKEACQIQGWWENNQSHARN